VPQAFELADLPEYAGCRSWVELAQSLPTEGAKPVVDDESFHNLQRTLDKILTPTAYA
jgi:hypothetical protein